MERVADRFLRYVKIHTTSDEGSMTTPTTSRQFDLAKLLVRELGEIGCEDVRCDEKC